MTPHNIFLCCPTHDTRIDYRMAIAFMQKASEKHNTMQVIQASSLLANNCNNLWSMALNNREKHGLTWFAMLHSDVVPENFWLDKLIDIAESNDADVLSAIIPIKNHEGLTSTCIGDKNNHFNFKARLTQKQIHHPNMPETFDRHALISFFSANEDAGRFQGWSDPENPLLVNTGCMVARLDRPWSDAAFFTINDRNGFSFGNYSAVVEPEDWFFSRMVTDLGAKVMATKAVKLQHIGMTGYNSANVWGASVDPNSIPA